MQRCKEKCSFNYKNDGKVHIKMGDARNLKFIPDSSIDFICTHPPYADIIKYSKNLKADISHLGKKDFLIAMNQVC